MKTYQLTDEEVGALNAFYTARCCGESEDLRKWLNLMFDAEASRIEINATLHDEMVAAYNHCDECRRLLISIFERSLGKDLFMNEI